MINPTFFGGLGISSLRWWLNEPKETSRLADGSVITASLGAALWQGEAVLDPGYHEDQGATQALLAELGRPGQFFMAYDPRHNGPRMDPGGVILGAATPVIHTLASNNKEIRISGLPSGYVISPGDYIGWQYGSPARYALHLAVTGATASGAGLTPLFRITPFVRPGVVAGSTAVVLVQPAIKAVLLDATYGNARQRITEGGRIQFTQVLR